MSSFKMLDRPFIKFEILCNYQLLDDNVALVIIMVQISIMTFVVIKTALAALIAIAIMSIIIVMVSFIYYNSRGQRNIRC